MRWTKRRRVWADPNERILRRAEELWEEAQTRGVSAEKFIETLDETLDELVQPFVDRLLRDMPSMLRHRGRIRRGFERRLRKRWRRALDLYRATLEVALEAGSDFNQRHRPDAAQENDFLFEALVRLHARSCLTAFEVFTLLNSGYSDAAYARWRTLHELAVVSNVLVEHSGEGELPERFLLHEGAEQAWDAKVYQKYAPRLGYEPFSQEEIETLNNRRDELIDRFGEAFARPMGWAAPLSSGHPPTFAELEASAGMAHMQPWYKLQSHKLHATSKGAALNVLQRGPYQYFQAGPSNADLADPGHGALIALTQVTVCLLLRTRVERLGSEPLRIVISNALLRMTDVAGDAFLEAHQKLEADEERVWVDFERAAESDPNPDTPMATSFPSA